MNRYRSALTEFLSPKKSRGLGTPRREEGYSELHDSCTRNAAEKVAFLPHCAKITGIPHKSSAPFPIARGYLGGGRWQAVIRHAKNSLAGSSRRAPFGAQRKG